jgi:hypothetical protein
MESILYNHYKNNGFDYIKTIYLRPTIQNTLKIIVQYPIYLITKLERDNILYYGIFKYLWNENNSLEKALWNQYNNIPSPNIFQMEIIERKNYIVHNLTDVITFLENDFGFLDNKDYYHLIYPNNKAKIIENVFNQNSENINVYQMRDFIKWIRRENLDYNHCLYMYLLDNDIDITSENEVINPKKYIYNKEYIIKKIYSYLIHKFCIYE